jgi:hypothetical protein
MASKKLPLATVQRSADTGAHEQRAGRGQRRGAIEENALQMRIPPENCRKELALAPADVDERA